MGGRDTGGQRCCHSRGVCEAQRHCVPTGMHMPEPPAFCLPRVHRALELSLSRLWSHFPAFSCLALRGLVQRMSAKPAR